MKIFNCTFIGTRGQAIEWRRQFRSVTPPSGKIYTCKNYTLTTTERRKVSMQQRCEMGVGESNGDVISVLERYPVDDFAFSQITRKPSLIGENCQRNTDGKLGQGIERWRHFRSRTPRIGRFYIFPKYTETVTERQKFSALLIGNPGLEIERWRHFRSRTPPSGRIHMLAILAIADER
jgi:hypothetical protein